MLQRTAWPLLVRLETGHILVAILPIPTQAKPPNPTPAPISTWWQDSSKKVSLALHCPPDTPHPPALLFAFILLSLPASPSSLRPHPFDVLPSTSSLQRPPFDVLPSTSSLRPPRPLDLLPSPSYPRPTLSAPLFPSSLLLSTPLSFAYFIPHTHPHAHMLAVYGHFSTRIHTLPRPASSVPLYSPFRGLDALSYIQQYFTSCRELLRPATNG
ncbi:hypothetical protein B0T26DRAFT_365285 [Lasiosphaeria miniovina]|uniref:Uncharacterized protein n=1 Tax=Lasiosphaeria miniovina TaxID=1954250 RepID=A0AA40ACT3_9PEZI|nr:uncharacterized protein B0T26DRAFT_365285 [Lasiosphaeria miniovina]KAK0713471.1 hypothetical protein B0T26DRAFT_365285 [Lasiosphaeria miniovina]